MFHTHEFFDTNDLEILWRSINVQSLDSLWCLRAEGSWTDRLPES